MKRALLLVLFATTIMFGQDFRNSNWGDSVEKVKKAEKEGVFESKYATADRLTYSGIRLAGVKCVLMYNFVNGKLVRAAYGNAEGHYQKITNFK